MQIKQNKRIKPMRIIGWQTGVTGSLVGLALVFGAAGCKSSSTSQPANVIDANNGPDPAAVNEASGSGYAQPPTQVLSSSSAAQNTARGESYAYNNPNQDNQTSQGSYDPDYDNYDASQVDAGQQALYATEPPPPIPEYQQTELTVAGDEWTPGYWNYGSGGYYWVPGAWVAPPYEGGLWTPGYWGFLSGRYRFHRGYWARHIGFYGGINYGFGYGGSGYEGGYWNNNQFYYNDRYNRVNTNVVRTVYTRNVRVENNTYVNNRVSYNNGPGGVPVRPNPQQLAVLHEQRTPPMQVQKQRVATASQNKQQFFAENHGKPGIAAAPERLAADHTPPQPIRQGPVQGANPVAMRQQQQAQQQQIHTQQAEQQNQRNQQRTQQPVEQQRDLQQNAQRQQQAAQQQQQNAQHQQQAAQHQQQAAQQQQVRVQQQQQAGQRAQQQQAQQQQQRAQQQQQRAQQQQVKAQQATERNQQQAAQQHQEASQQHQQAAQQHQQAAQEHQQAAQRPQPAARPEPAQHEAAPHEAAPHEEGKPR